MSVMDKLMNAMKFNDDDEEFGDEELDEEYYDNSRDVPAADRNLSDDNEEEDDVPVKKEETAPRLRRRSAETRADSLPPARSRGLAARRLPPYRQTTRGYPAQAPP